MSDQRRLAGVFYPETVFGGFTRVDGTIAFYQRVNALLESGSTVLDVGCGRGEYAEDPVESRREQRVLRGKCASVIGVDSDPAAAGNRYVDEFRLICSDTWPVGETTVDLCLADNVLEHVERPEAFLAECRRVLKPNAHLCIRTANALGYPAVAARLTPNAAHSAILGRVQPDRQAADVFPTFYRCNTARRLRHDLRAAGFEACVYGHGPEPSYLGFSSVAYAVGVAWTRLVPSVLQATLFAFARRLP